MIRKKVENKKVKKRHQFFKLNICDTCTVAYLMIIFEKKQSIVLLKSVISGGNLIL